jgi:hypothetical protein
VTDAKINDVAVGKITGTVDDPAFITGLAANKINAGSLGTNVIASSIAVNAVYPASVQSGTYGISVTGSAGSVSGNINSNQINAGTLPGNVIASSIAVNAVYVDAIQDSAVTSAKLAGSIPDSKLNAISTAGKVADTALSSNVNLLNANQTITGVKTFTSSATVNADLKTTGQITAGSGNNTITTAAGLLDATKLSGALPALDGGALTSVNAAQLGGQAGSYYQDANNLNAGTLSDSRLSTNVDLLNANQTVSGVKTHTSSVTVTSDFKATGQITAGSGNNTITTATGLLDASKLSGTVPVANGGTGLASGTSGGILGFTASGTLASSNLLTANAVVIGGGAGATPSALALGTGDQILGMNNGATAHEYKTIQAAATSGGLTVTHSANAVSIAQIPSRTSIGQWSATNMAANLTNSQIFFVVGAAAQNAAGSRIKMPYDGKVVGMAVSGSAARTGGTATFHVFKGGSDIGTSSDVLINGTNTQLHYSTGGTDTFVAGDILDVRVTTSGTWAPTTAEWTATVFVEWTN